MDVFQTVNRTLTKVFFSDNDSENQSSNADKALKEDFSWATHKLSTGEHYVFLIGGTCDRRSKDKVSVPWA